MLHKFSRIPESDSDKLISWRKAIDDEYELTQNPQRSESNKACDRMIGRKKKEKKKEGKWKKAYRWSNWSLFGLKKIGEITDKEDHI